MIPFSGKWEDWGIIPDQIQKLIAKHRKTRIIAHQFFISWHGVPTLGYTGFSPVLLHIKETLPTLLPSLKKENPGSLWPKTTLGALSHDKTLSLDELIILKAICEEMETKVKGEIINIDHLSLVAFQCRSLEKRFSTISLPLSDPRDTRPPMEAHKEKVDAVMDQFSRPRLPEYLEQVRKPGHRIHHYHKEYHEATLAVDLPAFLPAITLFQEKVDRMLPRTYSWFHPDSLHITIRGLEQEL
jgi:hypothetical protein